MEGKKRRKMMMKVKKKQEEEFSNLWKRGIFSLLLISMRKRERCGASGKVNFTHIFSSCFIILGPASSSLRTLRCGREEKIQYCMHLIQKRRECNWYLHSRYRTSLQASRRYAATRRQFYSAHILENKIRDNWSTGILELWRSDFNFHNISLLSGASIPLLF